MKYMWLVFLNDMILYEMWNLGELEFMVAKVLEENGGFLKLLTNWCCDA